MNDPIEEKLKQAIPMRRMFEPTEEVARAAKCYVYEMGEKEVRRWWSTEDPEKLKDAILTLTHSGIGFNIQVVGPAFAEAGCLDHDSTLEFRHTGYGASWMGPPDVWHVLYEGKEVGRFDNPEKALDFFFQFREEKELGQDMAERGFSGSGGPSISSKKAMAAQEEPPRPDPKWERGQWVFKSGAVGIVTAVEGDKDVPEGFVAVWFGSQGQVELVPAIAVTPAEKPEYHNGYFMG